MSESGGKLLNLHRAAEFLGVTSGSLYTLKRTKRIAYIMVGRNLRFHVDDLETFVRQSRVPAVSEQ